MTSITTEIQNHLNAVNAILILAIGSVPRITVGMNYALTALSALFPKSMANNIGFLLSNVPNEMFLQFPHDAIPVALKHAPTFLIDNPIALQKNYLGQLDRMSERTAKKRKALVKVAEQDALEMLVTLFDWLDGLEPQPTMGTIALYKKSWAIESMITMRAEIKNRMEMKFAVSFHLLPSDARISYSLDVERECCSQPRKGNKFARLEAGARSHLPLSLWRASLLLHLLCGR